MEVRLRHLHLQRMGRAVLSDVSWRIRPAERWVLVGGNGAGKTQLLKLISGAIWPSPPAGAGAIPSRQYRWRGEVFLSPFEVQEEIGYLGAERQDKYERYGWNHTVEQIVGTGLQRSDIPLAPLTAADRNKIAVLLSRLGIEPLRRRRLLALSYGERRLALLARTLAARPKLLLLDELLSGLDERNHARALHWLERTGRSNLPWVLATHRLEDIPHSATHAVVLNDGRIAYSGTLRRAPLKRWLKNHRGPSRSHPPSARPCPVPASGRRARTGTPGALLVRLSRASVYLDGHRVLESLSFEVRAGECWVVHGRNGSGKTTLLRALYGDHAIAAGGRIERAGIEPGMPLQQFKRRVGLVAPHLQAEHPQALTVAQVVQSARHASIGLNAAPTAADRAAARRSLDFFGLAALAPRTLRELSYGQLRRVLFARAWACRPRLLLLDEPFSGVDAPTRTGLMEQLRVMFAGGTGIVLTTHYRSEWPRYATHELELAGGRAVYSGLMRASGTLTHVPAGA